MKKRIMALTLCLCLALGLCAPALAADDAPTRGEMTCSVAIQPQYEEAQAFNDGLAAVKRNGKWGYIDYSGKTVIPFQYDLTYAFHEGFAVVGKFNGVVDEDGDPCVLLNIVDGNGRETPFIAPYGWDDTTGEDMKDAPYRTYMDVSRAGMFDKVFYNGMIPLHLLGEPGCALYNTAGEAIDLRDTYREVQGWQVAEGMVILGIEAAEGGEMAYYDMATGKTIEAYRLVEALGGKYADGYPYFAYLYPFNQGLAPVEIWHYDDGWNVVNDGIGFINKSGSWVIRPQFHDYMVSGTQTMYRLFGETGLAMMKDGSGKWGAVDKTGKTVIPFQYEGLRPYCFGLAAFKQGGKYGYLDGNGKVAVPAQYELTSGFSSEGYAAAYDGSKAFLIDAKGNRISGSENLDPDSYFKDDDGDGVPTTYTPGAYTVIKENGRYGFGRISYLPPLPEITDMDAWAYPEVVAAIEHDLVPTYLQNLYLNNMNRNEFCDMVVQAMEAVLGKGIKDIVKEKTGKDLSALTKTYPFVDSTSSNAVAANALGIVQGRGNGIFDPYAQITRQEAAAYLMRAAKVLGMDTSKVKDAGFSDGDKVGVWFTDAVNFVYQINVMNGTDSVKNTFSPEKSYTREQSYVTIYRLFKAVTGQE